jgi:hypothetical protein
MLAAEAEAAAACTLTDCNCRPPQLIDLDQDMSAKGLGCVKTQQRSIAIEELIRPRSFLKLNSKANST